MMEGVRARLSGWFFPAAIIAAGWWAYHNSLGGPFILDDLDAMTASPFRPETTVAGRPVLSLSLALTRALFGPGVWGYHLVNVAIHLIAALVLFGIIRRTFGSASQLALAVSLLWVVHPLLTSAVTYTIQRAESLMGLCYLLTLYSVIRSAQSRFPRRWLVAAVTCCALGMGTKEVMVSAPLIVLLYDRTFLTGSFRDSLRRRRALYLGLAATWILLAVLMGGSPRSGSTGFGMQGVSAWAYAMTQPGVLLHYLRLALWPHPLVLHYGWPLTTSWREAWGPSSLIAGLLLATLWVMRHRPSLGFLGAWVFLILAPTSSIIPIKDPIAEHRMYLPLMALITVLVIGGWKLLEWLLPIERAARRALAAGLTGLIVFGFGLGTIRRNEDYYTEETIWRDTVRKRPANPQAHNGLGEVLARAGRLDEAVGHFRTAAALSPDYVDAHYNLGLAYATQGRWADAAACYRRALNLAPDDAEIRYHLGTALLRQGRTEEALAHYDASWGVRE